MKSSITEQQIIQLLTNNPAYRNLYGEILEFCRSACDEEEAIAFAERQRTSKSHIQDGSAIVSVLVNKGALSQAIFIDEEVYEGSWRELQQDETISDEACISIALQTTQESERASASVRKLYSVQQLINENPERVSAFKTVLSLCDGVGRSTREIQQVLKEEDMLDTEPERDIDHLHASYFTGMLEKVGALFWQGGSWVTSEEGKAILRS